jgi:hypothetical protein
MAYDDAPPGDDTGRPNARRHAARHALGARTPLAVDAEDREQHLRGESEALWKKRDLIDDGARPGDVAVTDNEHG